MGPLVLILDTWRVLAFAGHPLMGTEHIEDASVAGTETERISMLDGTAWSS